MKVFAFNFTRFISFAISVSLALLSIIIYNGIFGDKNTTILPTVNYLVVVDAGHGGIDSGVTGVKSGVCESDLNLAIALKLKGVFERSGIRVVLTRKSSGGLYGSLSVGHKKRDMQARRKIIEECNPTLVISIHQNQYHLSSRRGAQVFFNQDSDNGKLLAGCIQNQLNGLVAGGRSYSALKGDYYILNISPCPAVIVECGFLSNEQDEALLLSEDYQSLLAEGIYNGVIQYFGGGGLIV